MSRYSQQISLPELGKKGQKQLSEARILIIGAGGLGNPLATYLAAMGVGYITITDGDIISETNLHRQFCFWDKDINKHKSQTLAECLKNQNPGLTINYFNHYLNEKNASKFIQNHDVVCDCTDNVTARILIDKICGDKKKPLIYATVVGWSGYVAVLHYKKGIKLNDIFSIESLLKNPIIDCNNVGVMPSVCGIIASIQATELIKCILEDPFVSDGKIICFDGRKMEFRKFKINSNS